ncbi:MAG: HIT family protein, partial [Proteobacteria bacterium]|nr:HIT family protein [Pseudomonadota bacterium]
IPKRHFESIFDATVEEHQAFWDLIIKGKELIDNEYNPDGFNIGVNDGQAAGQSIFHVHIHMIPRYVGDVEEPLGGIRGIVPKKQKY